MWQPRRTAGEPRLNNEGKTNSSSRSASSSPPPKSKNIKHYKPNGAGYKPVGNESVIVPARKGGMNKDWRLDGSSGTTTTIAPAAKKDTNDNRRTDRSPEPFFPIPGNIGRTSQAHRWPQLFRLAENNESTKTLQQLIPSIFHTFLHLRVANSMFHLSQNTWLLTKVQHLQLQHAHNRPLWPGTKAIVSHNHDKPVAICLLGQLGILRHPQVHCRFPVFIHHHHAKPKK